MNAETPPARSATKKVFSLAIVVYALASGGVLLFVYWGFGIGVEVLILSLVLGVPGLVAVRMRYQCPAVRGRDCVVLLVVLIFVLAGSGCLVWSWYEKCMDRQHAADLRFREFAHVVRQDSAFRHVEIDASQRGYGPYWIRGTVASQADLDRLKSLADQYDFGAYTGMVKVADNPSQAKD